MNAPDELRARQAPDRDRLVVGRRREEGARREERRHAVRVDRLRADRTGRRVDGVDLSVPAAREDRPPLRIARESPERRFRHRDARFRRESRVREDGETLAVRREDENPVGRRGERPPFRAPPADARTPAPGLQATAPSRPPARSVGWSATHARPLVQPRPGNVSGGPPARRNTCTESNAPPAATRPVTSSSASAFTRVSANARLEPQGARRGVEDPQRLAVSRGERKPRSERAIASFGVSRAATRKTTTRPGPRPRGRRSCRARGARGRARRERRGTFPRVPEAPRPGRRPSARAFCVRTSRARTSRPATTTSSDPTSRFATTSPAASGMRVAACAPSSGRRYVADGAPSTAVRRAAPRRAVASGGAGISRTSVRRPERRGGSRARGRWLAQRTRDDGEREENEGDGAAPHAARDTVRLGVRLGGGDRGGKRRGRARDLGTRNRAHVRREPIAHPRHRREIAGALLALSQGPADDEDGLRQAPVAHDDIGPDRGEQLLARHGAAGMPHEIGENVERLRGEREGLGSL